MDNRSGPQSSHRITSVRGSYTRRRHGRLLVQQDDEDEAPTIVGTDGPYLTDARGKRYLDFRSGWNVGNFGWNNRLLAEAVRTFQGPPYVYPEHRYEPWFELAALLLDLAPRRLQRCFRATGGTEAVDLALQMAMRHTGRREFIGLAGAYHGNSIAAMSIGADADSRKELNLLSGCHQVDAPVNEKAVGKIETLLKRHKIAAVILEPVSLNLGVRIPEAGAMSRVQELCRRHGALFIMDEVACGFGRTGKIFASEHFDLDPDILCVAKAITGGYAPMGAVLASAPVAKSMAEDGEFYSTFGWHPLATHVAIANVRAITRNKKALLRHTAALSAHFEARLRTMPFKVEPRLNVIGLAIGVSLEDESYAKRIRAKCQDNGLLMAGDDGLSLFPPLTLDHDTADEGLDILEDCL
ncbi:MAG: aspartate aminotransferase family protein [Rhodospirillaceae bacterium]